MSFRRNGKSAHKNARSWNAWVAANADLLRAAGLPLSVFRSRQDWKYLLKFGYHCDGAYPNIDFMLDEMTQPQRAAFQTLLERVLTEEEKQRGSAGWHFVHPPG
jgi:hypothetical protein